MDKHYQLFAEKLSEACVDLAKKIVKDGEGVSKFIEYKVINAKEREDAAKIIRTVSDSSLVKTAMFGKDPNWGRIIAAAGRSGAKINPDKTDLYIGNYPLLKEGQPVNMHQDDIRALLEEQEIYVTLNLNMGKESAIGWGSDLTVEYVKFNAEYTT